MADAYSFELPPEILMVRRKDIYMFTPPRYFADSKDMVEENNDTAEELFPFRIYLYPAHWPLESILERFERCGIEFDLLFYISEYSGSTADEGRVVRLPLDVIERDAFERHIWDRIIRTIGSPRYN